METNSRVSGKKALGWKKEKKMKKSKDITPKIVCLWVFIGTKRQMGS